MSDKQPMQADGAASAKADEPGPGKGGAGESGGGAYPNPHAGQSPKDGVLGHGGQTEIDQKFDPGEVKR